MKYAYILCLLLIVSFIPVFLEGAETLQYIPDSCFSVVTVSNVQSDKGVSWLIDAWINSPRESPLRDLLTAVPAQEMSVALFHAEGRGSLSILLVVNIPSGKKADKALLDKLIDPSSSGSIQTTSYKNTTIAYTTAGDITDYAAYAVVQNNILAAATLDILKLSLDGPAIGQAAGYRSMQSVLPANQDGQLFTDNSGSQFVKFLRPLEDKWGMSLLLSADYLQWMGASFDFIDSQRVSGNFVFQGKDTSHMEDIQDDADFLGETFKRKFIAEKIKYESDVEVDGKTVVLNFTIEGLEPLWTKLFEQGVLSLFRLNTG
jgi:hypothetical protein